MTVCTNGKDALGKLRDPAMNFDLVLSDVYMPGRSRCLPVQVAIRSVLLRASSSIVHPDAVGYMYTDMDGFRLLEHVGLELDLPVISTHLALSSLCRAVVLEVRSCASTSQLTRVHELSDVIKRRDNCCAAWRHSWGSGFSHQASTHRRAAKCLAARCAKKAVY